MTNKCCFLLEIITCNTAQTLNMVKTRDSVLPPVCQTSSSSRWAPCRCSKGLAEDKHCKTKQNKTNLAYNREVEEETGGPAMSLNPCMAEDWDRNTARHHRHLHFLSAARVEPVHKHKSDIRDQASFFFLGYLCIVFDGIAVALWSSPTPIKGWRVLQHFKLQVV